MDPTLELQVNGAPRRVPAPGGALSVADLVDALGLAGTRVAVELNGEVVPRAERGTRRLAGGDRVEVVTFVGGG